MPLEAGQQLARYRLIEKIGEGGMGVVWRALDTGLGREIALKTLPDGLAHDARRLARLEAEARAVAALSHPHIVTLHSIEEAEGCRFLTMELVPGRPLSELIPDGGMPVPELLQIGLAVARALAAAHRRGVTHRDVKPRNILVDGEGGVKVLDFGLAVLVESSGEGDPAEAPTRPFAPEAELLGTLAYMAPEQLRSERADGRSDVFSLGVVLYQMATGLLPFRGRGGELVAAILREAPDRPSRYRAGLPHELDWLIGACLEKDPALRPADDELRRSLERASRGQQTGQRERSIAVLPFADMSRERDQEYFCEGVAEEILLALRQVPGLRVASRSASFRLGAGADAREAGHKLGVATLLDGSVRRSGDRLRIAVELIDTSDGFQLWSGRHEGSLSDVFALQDEIALGVVEALRVKLPPGGTSGPGTREVEAYDLYLRGRKLYYEYGRRGVQEALALFAKAIERDPAYARAYAGIADCRCFLFLYSTRDPSDLERAAEAALAALRLDAGLAEAHASQATTLSLKGHHAEAEAAFATATRLDPDLYEAHYFRARDAFAQGKREEAVRAYEEAMRVRPEDCQAPLLVAQSYDDLGRPELATGARRRGVRLAEERLALQPNDVRALYLGANGLVALGESEKGLDWARRAVALEPAEPMVLYNVACIRSLAGDLEGALSDLERAVGLGLAQRGWLEHDSNLDAIRGDPRFQALLARL
jgi:TolB-like protein/Flp pilus assembly protein TadD